MSIRIYVVDDHEIMREMLVDYLTIEPGFEVCGMAGRAGIALAEIGDLNPDLMLVDTAMPEMSGIDLVRRIGVRWPDLPCLMYSGHAEATYVQRSLDAGARGYMIKGDPDEIPEAIRTVMNGAVYLSGTVKLAMEKEGE